MLFVCLFVFILFYFLLQCLMAGLELDMEIRLALNSQRSLCIWLLSAKIRNVHSYFFILLFLSQKTPGNFPPGSLKLQSHSGFYYFQYVDQVRLERTRLDPE